jgi:hypothetical protein
MAALLKTISLFIILDSAIEREKEVQDIGVHRNS